MKKDGTVWTWGLNDRGQLGDGTTALRAKPVPVKGFDGAQAIACGAFHTLAVKKDGSVWCWGSNSQGQLGDGSGKDQPQPVQAKGVQDVISIAGGDSHSLALRKDGTVWAWGRNHRGQLGDGSTTDRSAPAQVKGLGDVSVIASGAFHAVALKKDGTVWTWGANSDGRLGDGSIEMRSAPARVEGLDGAIAIAAGACHTIALKKDGTVAAWGANWSEAWMLSDGTTMDSLVPSQVIGLTDLEATGWPVVPLKTPFVPLGDIVRIVAGGFHSAGIKKDGTVWTWGQNHYWGQLGDGTVEWRTNPVQVRDLSGVAAIAGGQCHTVAQKNDGSVWTWGANVHGQLGIGATDTNPHPQPLRVNEF